MCGYLDCLIKVMAAVRTTVVISSLLLVACTSRDSYVCHQSYWRPFFGRVLKTKIVSEEDVLRLPANVSGRELEEMWGPPIETKWSSYYPAEGSFRNGDLIKTEEDIDDRERYWKVWVDPGGDLIAVERHGKVQWPESWRGRSATKYYEFVWAQRRAQQAKGRIH